VELRNTAFDEALVVAVIDGEIVLTSSIGATAVALTPRAALETANRLTAVLSDLDLAASAASWPAAPRG
jgi:hypothetical protein